jgi:O-acetyl-ADP-ribose deacetylase (regulator of RNase III)
MQKARVYPIGASTLTLQFGDLTKSKADVLVSSDDDYISMGGGVSAAIRLAAGEAILLDIAKKIPARLGDVVVTSAGSLSAKHVFHAITIGDGDTPAIEIISSTTRRALQLLQILQLRSIAFPAIGAGVAGFSYEDVAVQMADVIVSELRNSPSAIQATIYLYDRFGEMDQIDYLKFFEEFAVRTHALGGVAADPPQQPANVARRSKRKPADVKRVEALERLALLDRERQDLEGRVTSYRESLAESEMTRVKKRLSEIQDERLSLLPLVTPKAAGPVTVFVSYAHADERLRKKLGRQLSVLEQEGIVAMWHDRMIGAGAEWAGAIDARLDAASVILLLVSPDFIDSKYCRDVELKRALQRHEKREALVVPIILRPVSFKNMPFAKLQALPKDAKPVMTWSNVDTALVDVTDGLRIAIQQFVGAP